MLRGTASKDLATIKFIGMPLEAHIVGNVE